MYMRTFQHETTNSECNCLSDELLSSIQVEMYTLNKGLICNDIILSHRKYTKTKPVENRTYRALQNVLF